MCLSCVSTVDIFWKAWARILFYSCILDLLFIVCDHFKRCADLTLEHVHVNYGCGREMSCCILHTTFSRRNILFRDLTIGWVTLLQLPYVISNCLRHCLHCFSVCFALCQCLCHIFCFFSGEIVVNEVNFVKKCISTENNQDDLVGKLICTNFKVSFLPQDASTKQVQLQCEFKAGIV